MKIIVSQKLINEKSIGIIS